MNQILVVDDDPAVRAVLEHTLTRAGYDTQTAATAEQALESLASRSVPVVLTDLVLPGLGGYELIEHIKRDRDVDVLVMTGYVREHSYVEAIEKGASDFILKPIRPDELLLRTRRVFEERHLRETTAAMVRELQQLVITDSLTGLYNSRHFHSLIDVEIHRAARYQRTLSLLMLDLDHFKQFNDTYGHPAGDNALALTGRLIRSCLRSMDVAFRYGGEEFTVLLPETGGAAALGVANRIRAVIESAPYSPTPPATVRVSISVGVTEYAPPESGAAFVGRADQALYQSKGAGRNRATFLEPDRPAPAAR
jgi:diguanylate cyclase (GGDEF)-like protein